MKKKSERKFTHGKMQMSLEAITMLMRFHHRSCCSGIRDIFHPYLENCCVLKIGDTLPSSKMKFASFHFQHPQAGWVWKQKNSDLWVRWIYPLFTSFLVCILWSLQVHLGVRIVTSSLCACWPKFPSQTLKHFVPAVVTSLWRGVVGSAEQEQHQCVQVHNLWQSCEGVCFKDRWRAR